MTALRLEDFVNDRTLAAFVAERLAEYEDKALRYLDQVFPGQFRLITAAAQRDLVRRAYRNARRRGLRTERDHLKYLIPVMHWGSDFETAPLHRSRLIRAGWLDQDGGRRVNPYLAPVLEQIDDWHRQVRPDQIDPSRLSALLQEPMPQDLSDRLAHLWPTVFAATPRPDWDETVQQAAAALSDPRAGLLHAAIAVLLGPGFATDPQHPWAAAPDPAALAAGFCRHWQARFTTERGDE